MFVGWCVGPMNISGYSIRPRPFFLPLLALSRIASTRASAATKCFSHSRPGHTQSCPHPEPPCSAPASSQTTPPGPSLTPDRPTWPQWHCPSHTTPDPGPARPCPTRPVPAGASPADRAPPGSAPRLGYIQGSLCKVMLSLHLDFKFKFTKCSKFWDCECNGFKNSEFSDSEYSVFCE
jgi:hypothetical protein